MSFRVTRADIPDVLILEQDVLHDHRGFFLEAYKKTEFERLGLPSDFVQLSHSRSRRGVIRGLHFQWEAPMAKLMRVTQGEAYLVAVDIRHGSPTIGEWVGVQAAAEDHIQLFAPPGFARGFCATSDWTEVQYLCTAVYNPAGEAGIRWDDERIGIIWPVKEPVLSDKDARAQSLDDWLAMPESRTFTWSGDTTR